MFLRNVGIFRRVYTAPKPRRTSSPFICLFILSTAFFLFLHTRGTVNYYWRGYEGPYQSDKDVFERRNVGKRLEQNTIRQLFVFIAM
jgi:hypothetical protein